MTGKYNLIIKFPSGDFVNYASHFNVSGNIEHSEAVPDNAVLTVRLYDSNRNVVRYAAAYKKNNTDIYAYHPDLTCYDEETDPGREQLKKTGFAELIVKDTAAPYDTLRDATIKCWYSDDSFRAVIVSGTDTEHGMVWNDGIGYTDENGQPYNVLDEGEYTVNAELASADGKILAEAFRKITVGHSKNQAICRFNPAEHRRRMIG